MTILSQLPRHKRAVAYAAIVVGIPVVCLWRMWVALKWRVWSGRIYMKNRHGRR